MENIICHLCAGSPEIELYPIELTNKQQQYLNKTYSPIKVDLCIGKEIKFLIENGIKTKGCCCGHGKYQPSCLVDKAEKNKLDKLGYEYIDYNNTNMYDITLKTNIQLELRKVLANKIFRYLVSK